MDTLVQYLCGRLRGVVLRPSQRSIPPKSDVPSVSLSVVAYPLKVNIQNISLMSWYKD